MDKRRKVKSKHSDDEPELGDGVYAAEKLLKRRKLRGQIEYLVKWKDWTDEDNTWEPAANILDKRLIEEFEQSLKNKNDTPRGKAGRKPKITTSTPIAIPEAAKSSTKTKEEEQENEKEKEDTKIDKDNSTLQVQENKINNEEVINTESNLQEKTNLSPDATTVTEKKNIAVISSSSSDEIYFPENECRREDKKGLTPFHATPRQPGRPKGGSLAAQIAAQPASSTKSLLGPGISTYSRTEGGKSEQVSGTSSKPLVEPTNSLSEERRRSADRVDLPVTGKENSHLGRDSESPMEVESSSVLSDQQASTSSDKRAAQIKESGSSTMSSTSAPTSVASSTNSESSVTISQPHDEASGIRIAKPEITAPLLKKEKFASKSRLELKEQPSIFLSSFSEKTNNLIEKNNENGSSMSSLSSMTNLTSAAPTAISTATVTSSNCSFTPQFIPAIGLSQLSKQSRASSSTLTSGSPSISSAFTVVTSTSTSDLNNKSMNLHNILPTLKAAQSPVQTSSSPFLLNSLAVNGTQQFINAAAVAAGFNFLQNQTTATSSSEMQSRMPNSIIPVTSTSSMKKFLTKKTPISQRDIGAKSISITLPSSSIVSRPTPLVQTVALPQQTTAAKRLNVVQKVQSPATLITQPIVTQSHLLNGATSSNFTNTHTVNSSPITINSPTVNVSSSVSSMNNSIVVGNSHLTTNRQINGCEENKNNRMSNKPPTFPPSSSTQPLIKRFHSTSNAILNAQQKSIKHCPPPADFLRKQLLADNVIVTDVVQKNVMITIRECSSQDFFKHRTVLKAKKKLGKVKKRASVHINNNIM